MSTDILDIVLENEALIYAICKKFYNIEEKDLYQAGCVGLMKAYNNYNKNCNCKFSSYAYPYIFGEMYELYMNISGIKYNKEYLRLYKQVELIKNKLWQINGYEPSYDDIACALNITSHQVAEIILMGQTIISLDDENRELNLHEIIPGKEIDINTKILVDDSFKVLDKVEQDIMRMRYFEDLSQDDTAKKLGLTQVMVSRYEKNSKEKIREYINA